MRYNYAVKCAELCQLFLFGVNSLDDIKPLEPDDEDDSVKK